MSRRELAYKLLIEPLDPYRGWATAVREVPQPTDDQFKPWAIHVVYGVSNGQDDLHTPLTMTFIEIDHYDTDNALRNVIGLNRERIQRVQNAKIDEWEDARKTG